MKNNNNCGWITVAVAERSKWESSLSNVESRAGVPVKPSTDEFRAGRRPSKKAYQRWPMLTNSLPFSEHHIRPSAHSLFGRLCFIYMRQAFGHAFGMGCSQARPPYLRQALKLVGGVAPKPPSVSWSLSLLHLSRKVFPSIYLIKFFPSLCWNR